MGDVEIQYYFVSTRATVDVVQDGTSITGGGNGYETNLFGITDRVVDQFASTEIVVVFGPFQSCSEDLFLLLATVIAYVAAFLNFREMAIVLEMLAAFCIGYRWTHASQVNFGRR